MAPVKTQVNSVEGYQKGLRKHIILAGAQHYPCPGHEKMRSLISFRNLHRFVISNSKGTPNRSCSKGTKLSHSKSKGRYLRNEYSITFCPRLHNYCQWLPLAKATEATGQRSPLMQSIEASLMGHIVWLQSVWGRSAVASSWQVTNQACS